MDCTEYAGSSTRRNDFCCLEVVIIDDLTVEINEYFLVTLTTSSSVLTLGASQTTVTIIDTDSEVYIPAELSVTEDDGTVQVCATLITFNDAVGITVTLATSNGTGTCINY